MARNVRGKNKTAAWKMPTGQPMATLVLSLDTSDARARRRLERLYFTMFNIRRALQRDATARCRSYWARKEDRDTLGWKYVAEDLGLTRNSFEQAARAHFQASGWAADHVSAALVNHMAAAIFENVRRHLWSDASGKRHGALRLTAFHDFATIHGRARSHSVENKWETFRLYGSLEGHLDTYRHGDLGVHPTLAQIAALRSGSSVLNQHTMTTPGVTKWSSYAGPLVMVFAGGPQSNEPELQLPVKLPKGRGQWDRMVHFLSDAATWHKIDLVRRQDTSQPGGWRYEMHLLVLHAGYTSARNQALLDAAPSNRVACVDVNVSNLSVFSVPASRAAPGPTTAQGTDIHSADLRSTTVRATIDARDHLVEAAAKKRRGQRLVDRSRRASNQDQYAHSAAQTRRDERRVARGLRAVTTELPRGPRHTNAKNVPLRSYRRDELSGAYRVARRRQGERDRAASVTKRARAQDIVLQLVATHGATWLIEDCNLTLWARRWGKHLHSFAPGMVTAGLSEIAESRGGSFSKMATGPTALSSHCLCGHRAKKLLSERRHTCLVCGLRGDRDLVSAALGTCVQLSDPRDAGTALVDYTRAAALLGALTDFDGTASDGTASDGTASDTSSSINHGHQDALTSQTHPLVGGRHSGVHHQGARSVGSSRRAARLNASKTMPPTTYHGTGPGHPGPAKVALDSGLGHPVPTG